MANTKISKGNEPTNTHDTKNAAMKHLSDELSRIFPGLSMKVRPGMIEIRPTREASPSQDGRG